MEMRVTKNTIDMWSWPRGASKAALLRLPYFLSFLFPLRSMFIVHTKLYIRLSPQRNQFQALLQKQVGALTIYTNHLDRHFRRKYQFILLALRVDE